VARAPWLEAIGSLPGVKGVFLSGSVGRGTSTFPVNDVDVVVDFHPWALPGASRAGPGSRQALEHLRELLTGALTPGGPVALREVAIGTAVKDHVVRCATAPASFVEVLTFRGSLTVDVMPAVRRQHLFGGQARELRVPSTRTARWHITDPQRLQEIVRERRAECDWFPDLVRTVKEWAKVRMPGMRSLAVEVLVIEHTSGTAGATRGETLATFFRRASTATHIDDPTGWCGAVQPGLALATLRTRLAAASHVAEEAVALERAGARAEAEARWKVLTAPPALSLFDSTRRFMLAHADADLLTPRAGAARPAEVPFATPEDLYGPAVYRSGPTTDVPRAGERGARWHGPTCGPY